MKIIATFIAIASVLFFVETAQAVSSWISF
jgi:hypothetical protein